MSSLLQEQRNLFKRLHSHSSQNQWVFSLLCILFLKPRGLKTVTLRSWKNSFLPLGRHQKDLESKWEGQGSVDRWGKKREKKGMFCSTLKLCELWHAALFCYHLSQWLLNNKCQSPFVRLGTCTFIGRLYCNTEIVFHLLGGDITKRTTWWGFQSLGLQNQLLNWSILVYLLIYCPMRRAHWNCLHRPSRFS